jgi:GNAT superfamily N-acetyltransferase
VSYTTRPLEPKDHEQWYGLWQAYLTFYEESLPDGITQNTWKTLLEPQIDPQGVCAVDEKENLLGIAHYMFHASCWTIGPYCYLQDLFVAKSARKAGIGRSLINHVAEEAKKRNAGKFYWLTKHDNVIARKLYDEVGALTPFIRYDKSLTQM